MRVLLSAYACAPGGRSERGNGWNWATALTEHGHDVTVLTTPSGREAIQEEIADRDLERLRVLHVAAPQWGEFLPGQVGVYWRYLAWQQSAGSAAKELLTTEAFDLVHHLTWGSLQLGAGVATSNIPFVFGPVGGGQVAAAQLRPYHRGRWATEALRTIVTRDLLRFDPFALRAVRRASLVLVNNDETAGAARRHGASSVQYCSEVGLAPEQVASEPPPPDPAALRLLWVGRIMPRKALPLALAAMSLLPPQTRVMLTVVGYGHLEGRIGGWIDEFRVADRVRFAGPVRWADMFGVYRQHDALLFTSLRDSSGAQLLEAMGSGLPVITLDHQGARRLVPDDAGMKVPLRTEAEIVRDLSLAIGLMAADPTRQRSMARAALKFARTQTWPNKAAEMTAHYDSVLADRSRSELS